MSSSVGGVIVVVALVVLIVFAYLLGKRNARRRTPGEPDHVTDDVVSGLMAELRKWQAESAYWKATAERLQRQLDAR